VLRGISGEAEAVARRAVAAKIVLKKGILTEDGIDVK